MKQPQLSSIVAMKSHWPGVGTRTDDRNALTGIRSFNVYKSVSPDRDARLMSRSAPNGSDRSRRIARTDSVAVSEGAAERRAVRHHKLACPLVHALRYADQPPAVTSPLVTTASVSCTATHRREPAASAAAIRCLVESGLKR